MVYLFLGQDALSKDEQLKKIRRGSFTATQEQFNQDILYGRETRLADLQEIFLRLPAAGAACRLIVIKDADKLDEKSRAYILDYAAKPYARIILVLEIGAAVGKDEFTARLCRLCEVSRFKEVQLPDTFALNRSISAGSGAQALKILDQLLKNGEKPERILGGLRYAWERETLPAVQSRDRLRLLLKCDLEIKTGRLRPVFALEKLVVSLCRAGKPF